MVTWCSYKQKVVCFPTLEVENYMVAKTTHKMVWLQSLLNEFNVTSQTLMPMYCDNNIVIFIFGNVTFHEHMKHYDIDFHFIYDKVLRRGGGHYNTHNVNS